LDIINETIFKAEIKVILLYVIVKIKTMASLIKCVVIVNPKTHETSRTLSFEDTTGVIMILPRALSTL
jgi:hypothetical protein